MTLSVKWLGVDMGECLMDVTPRRAHLLTGDTSKALGRPEMSNASCHRWRVVTEKYGSIPIVLERHKLELLSYAFLGDPLAADAYLGIEQKYLALADGAHEALAYLRDQGIALSIVTAARTSPGPLEDSCEFRFLEKYGLLQYFDALVTPRGRMRIADRSLDRRYEGTAKEDGTIYAMLAEDLATGGIAPEEAAMMGDREWTDITPAKRHGFKTILYTGYICRGPTEADLVIDHFSALKTTVKYGNGARGDRVGVGGSTG
jgi:FMN phosphatase YigB (HAD superfamily)